MKLIFNKIFLEHDTGKHPENKNRLKNFISLPNTEIPFAEKYLTLAHSPGHINKVKELSKKGASADPETVVCNKSYEVACYAAGAAILAAEQGSFALVRPPGHHATIEQSMGFCLFNNMAIAAKYMAKKGKRVFVIDFDIHHGNGTQEIVLGDKNIAYFSIHQSPAYPGSGLISEQNCINVPMQYQTSDEEYIGVLRTALAHELKKFKPDIVGLSAGFDSYFKDLNYLEHGLGFNLTAKSYLEIKKIIEPYHSFAVLEGGYNPESIKEGVRVFSNEN
jgi:acetoin utilization deacetylase AcuC-like enzyme